MSTRWTPKPGEPCPPARYTQAGLHAFVDEDELARRREAWHAMTNAPPPDPEDDEAPEAATAGASEGTDDRTTSETDAAPPAAEYAHGLRGVPHGPKPTQYAIDWAFEQRTDGPGSKLVLVALARHCFRPGDTRCFPSVTQLCKLASMGRTAVGENLARLQALGLIYDTGDRRGSTGRVVVWGLGNGPESGLLNSAESGPFNHPESEPLAPQSSGFRAGIVRNPDMEYPPKGGGGGAASAAAGAAAAAPDHALPAGLRPELFAKLVANGRDTESRVARLVEHAHFLAAGGHDLNAMAEDAIDRGWAGWPKPPRQHHPRVAKAAAPKPAPQAADDWGMPP